MGCGCEGFQTQVLYHVAHLVDPKRPGAVTMEDVVEFITTTIKPGSWDEEGGPAIIRVLPQGILAIDQTAESHEELPLRLAQLREAVQAEEDEAADLPEGGRPNADQQRAMHRAICHIGGLLADDVVQAIRGTISPESWKGEGGNGTIHVVRPDLTDPTTDAEAQQSPSSIAPTEPAGVKPAPAAPASPRPAVMLVVYQTRDVHREIAKFLQSLEVR
jgi:hypothetical protein